MKKQINVKIYKGGENNRVLLDCIASYNSGRANFSARDVEGYLAVQKAFVPSLGKGFEFFKGELPNEYHISEDDGKTFTMSLEWAEVYELETTEDIPAELFTHAKND